MPDMSLSMSLEDRHDDLPKTLRNRSLRTSDEPLQVSPSSAPGGLRSNLNLSEGIVTDIKIPFWRLVIFLMKVALACVPALLIVAMILWGIAEVTGALFPNLVKMKILIQVPQK
jgi:hypothetical protein